MAGKFGPTDGGKKEGRMGGGAKCSAYTSITSASSGPKTLKATSTVTPTVTPTTRRRLQSSGTGSTTT